MTAIALFPIPDCVSFPGTVFPLHVFEPRYRQMVHHCLEHDMPLGVCHTQKIISQPDKDQSIEEALQSNQASYKPYDIFSAGRCELIETLSDGRMAIHVHIDNRYRLHHETQTLPFRIGECELLLDQQLNSTEINLAIEARDKVMQRLQVITQSVPALQKKLANNEWQEKSPEAFSFEIFGLLRLPGDIAQPLLETRHPVDRLEALLDLLNQQQG